jgi:serine/threonine-protein kinase PknK
MRSEARRALVAGVGFTGSVASASNAHLRVVVVAFLIAGVTSGCGSPSASAPTRTNHHTAHAARPVSLRVTRSLGPLPAARTGAAAAVLGSKIVVNGGLSAAGTSTATVFIVGPNGAQQPGSSLPSPVHDAAATTIGNRLLLFGGGQAEGTDQIVEVLPGPSRSIATLPQPLSDLAAVSINGLAYVFGGWNGATLNRGVYAVRADGTIDRVGALPVGVRYPAAGALGGELILAGGETATEQPTAIAWEFDPRTRTARRLPDLPVATDHTSGAVVDGHFCVLGGLRAGAFTDAIVCWAPGESRWQSAGRLPAPLADADAVAFDRGIAVIGGRDSNGPVSTVTLLSAS